MADLNIVVLVKGVPDFSEGNIKFKEDNTLDRGSTSTVLNPNDHMALKAAREVQVKHGGTIHIMTMGPPPYKSVLAEALEFCGDDIVLLSDIKFAGADTWATAHALAYGIKKLGNVDLVFAGFKTADGETGQTGPQTSLVLDWPIITHCTNVEVDPEEGRVRAKRFVYDTVEECETQLPAVLVTDPAFEAEYRRASERLTLLDLLEEQEAKVEQADELLTTWNAEEIGAPEGKIGLKGSPTIVRMVEPIPVPPSERDAEVLDGSKPEDIEKLAEILVEKAGGA